MTPLRIKKSIIIIFIAALTATSIKAQISTPEGQIQGGNRGDTAHYVDKPSMHVHEQTIVKEIKKVGRSKSTEGGASNNTQANDSTRQSGNTTPAASSTDTIGGINQNEASGNGNMNTPNTSEVPVISNQNTTALYAALTAFGIGALIGLFLLVMILRDRKTSKLMALIHGALGLVGIGMLIVYSMFYTGLVVSIVILAIAATGGIIVFYKDVSNEPLPKWLVITHGVVAVAGVVTLIVFAIGK